MKEKMPNLQVGEKAGPAIRASFELASKYSPNGDQPEAIRRLLLGLEQKERYQTLLGVTGSGKTFTIANVIRDYGPRPWLYPTTRLWRHNSMGN